ncbi:MAG: cytochrome b/b6 domain-containing protein [Lentimicrobiaceae bacterium]|nr:cytochrome b/b6 domain-containing protein [Lentimicrobiaceae bacterium]MCO5265265.1 cytochrome b/b6 domain-containing protein [Lentimicrobium sp.]
MSEKLYLYPVWVRLWHALNAILIITLIISGVSMQYSNPDNPFIRFDLAVKLHNISGITLTISYLIFLIGNIITPNGKYYKLSLKGLFNRLMKQFIYYTIGIFKHETPPFPVTKERKFNPLQQFTYVVAMYCLVPVVILTGWAFLYPEVVFAKFLSGNLFKINNIIHVIIGFFLSFFMIIHIYFCTIGATFVSNFKSMINGFHESH